MKYISVAILVLLLSWTWSLATSPRDFDLQQHKVVEASVEEDIRGFIQRKYPSTAEIFCDQLYTENIRTGTEMVVHFRCQATGDTAREDVANQIFEGFIQLRSEDQFESWVETGGEIRSPQIIFQKGIQVNAAGDSEDAAPANNDSTESAEPSETPQ